MPGGEGPERSHLEEQSARLKLEKRATFAGCVVNSAPWSLELMLFSCPRVLRGCQNVIQFADKECSDEQ